MVNINVAALIRKKKETVYQALKEIEKFPSFLKDVKEIVIRSSNGRKIISDWKIDIDGTPIEWHQEMILDDLHQSAIFFRMIEGDYERYEGRWLLQEKADGVTRVELQAEFDWGVPGLERFVGKILEDKAIKSLKGMLYSLRKELHR